MNSKFDTVVFDFGGVLIDWNARYLYRKVFEDEQEMEWFLNHVCTVEWNMLQDKGFQFSETIPRLQKQYPEYSDQIKMYQSRWPEMVGGEISESIKILQEIQAKSIPVYGLTNWGSETFPIVFEQFEFLRRLKGIVVSGNEKMVKPDRGLFQILISRFALNPVSCIFIDDNINNIESAKEIGFKTIHFVSPENLRNDLQLLNVL
jgi:2-haloacid dehalogenase